MRTQVGIVGAGPAGLVLSHLLAGAGIASVVLVAHRRDYIERRTRAGVLEQGTADLLVATGVADRLQREGLVHRGIELRFAGQRHRIPWSVHPARDSHRVHSGGRFWGIPRRAT